MNDEIQGFKKQLDGFDQEIWSMGMNVRALQEHRADFPSAWIDTAIETVNRRYLDPHEDDTQETLTTLKKQQTMLHNMVTRLEEVHQLAAEIRLLVVQVDALLEQARRDKESAGYNIELSLRSQGDARAFLTQAQEHIAAAQTACP